MAKKNSFFNKIVWHINMLMALLLVGAYPASYVDPQTIWAFAFLGLGYPYFLLANILFVLYWSIRFKRYVFLSLLCIAIGWPTFQRSFALGSPKPLHVIVDNASEKNIPPKNATDENKDNDANEDRIVAINNKEFNVKDNLKTAGKDKRKENSKVNKNVPIKIMSYNVKNFDLYNWNENIEARNNMMELIKSEAPDVICFQEFYTEDDGDFHNVKLLVNELGFTHHFFAKTLTLYKTNHWGLAIFSKYPISNSDKVMFSDEAKHNILSYADIEIGDATTMRVFNVHLQSIHLGRKEIEYVKSLGDLAKAEDLQKQDHLKSSKSIIKKLRDAYIKRGKQAQMLHEYIEEASKKYPVVVCGDFNDTPTSYTYYTVSQNLQDAFLETNVGFGGTYPNLAPLFPFRIDYVLATPNINIHKFNIIHKDFSDHYPISCSFSLDTSKIATKP